MNQRMPPDRGNVGTEQRHPSSMQFDAMSIDAQIGLMVEDHRAVYDAVSKAQPQVTGFIDDVVKSLRRGGRLIYLGAGTSGRLGVLDASECPPTFQSDPDQIIGIIAGGESALRKSSEGLEDDPHGARLELEAISLNEKDTVLGIAAGGTTPYALGGISIASKLGATTGLLTCSATTTQPDDCDHLITLDTGPEILTGSTRLKAGSATKLALNIITTVAFTNLGKVHENLMVDLRATNDKLRDRAIRILQEFFPDIEREGAAMLLDDAGLHVKTAIVMRTVSVDRNCAHQMLQSHRGDLRAAVQTPVDVR